ncbi:unnamed protein product [Brassica oleracea var. botrytis]
MIHTFDRLTSLSDTMTLAQTCSRDGQGYVVICLGFCFVATFKDVPNTGKQTLFPKKLVLYCPLFDFTDPTKNVKEKEIKRQTLLEVVDYVATSNTKLSENAIQKAVRMVSANVFRSLNPQALRNTIWFHKPIMRKRIIQTSSALIIIHSLHDYIRALHWYMHARSLH